MIDMHIIVFILFTHWIADFVLQTDWMAQNKSKSWKALGAHVGIYTLVLAIINPLWAIVNGLAHGIVDAITSRISSYCYRKGDTHNFFVVIGFDQFLHAITLLGTYIWLVR